MPTRGRARHPEEHGDALVSQQIVTDAAQRLADHFSPDCLRSRALRARP